MEHTSRNSDKFSAGGLKCMDPPPGLRLQEDDYNYSYLISLQMLISSLRLTNICNIHMVLISLKYIYIYIV